MQVVRRGRTFDLVVGGAVAVTLDDERRVASAPGARLGFLRAATLYRFFDPDDGRVVFVTSAEEVRALALAALRRFGFCTDGVAVAVAL